MIEEVKEKIEQRDSMSPREESKNTELTEKKDKDRKKSVKKDKKKKESKTKVERRKSILEENAEKKHKEQTLSAEAKNVIIMLEYFKLEAAMILPQIFN